MFSFSPMDTAVESERPASALLPTTASPSAHSSSSNAGIKRKLDTVVSSPDVALSFEDKVEKLSDMGFYEQDSIDALLEHNENLALAIKSLFLLQESQMGGTDSFNASLDDSKPTMNNILDNKKHFGKFPLVNATDKMAETVIDTSMWVKSL